MLFPSATYSKDEKSLLARAAAWENLPALENLTAQSLRQLTAQEGVDFTTALLFDRFQKSPRHAAFISRMNALLSSPPRRHKPPGMKLVIVPGALYAERPDLGGDGRLVRDVAEDCGWQTDLIPLNSKGAVTENAEIIRTWLAQHTMERIVLISLSKGGADLKLALAEPETYASLRNVTAWINVCGPLNGTRLVDWVLRNRLRAWLLRLQYRVQRRDFGFISELSTAPRSPLDFSLKLPVHLKVLNLVGFPLKQHITTPFSRFCHRILAKSGPNDGTTLLHDLCEWPGETYPAWGVDHYFRPKEFGNKLIFAVLQYLAEGIALDRGDEFSGFSQTTSPAVA